MKKRSSLSVILYLAILMLIFWVMLSLFSEIGNDIAYSEVLSLFEHEQVQSFIVSGDKIYLNLHAPL